MDVSKNSILSKRTLFITVLVLIYLSFISLDITGGRALYSNILKFTVIIICFCYAFFSKSNNKSISYSLKTAMFFTLISDLFILILDYYIYGVLTFIIVQLLYNYRISCHNSKYEVQQQKESAAIGNNKAKEMFVNRTWFIFISRMIIQLLIASCICLILYLSGVELELLLVASLIYFTGLIINTIRAVIAVSRGEKEPGMRLFAAGLLLFVMCDINVGLFNLTRFISIPEETYLLIYNISSVLMWVFYAPSQALIALSVEKSKQ